MTIDFVVIICIWRHSKSCICVKSRINRLRLLRDQLIRTFTRLALMRQGTKKNVVKLTAKEYMLKRWKKLQNDRKAKLNEGSNMGKIK